MLGELIVRNTGPWILSFIVCLCIALMLQRYRRIPPLRGTSTTPGVTMVSPWINFTAWGLTAIFGALAVVAFLGVIIKHYPKSM